MDLQIWTVSSLFGSALPASFIKPKKTPLWFLLFMRPWMHFINFYTFPEYRRVLWWSHWCNNWISQIMVWKSAAYKVQSHWQVIHFANYRWQLIHCIFIQMFLNSHYLAQRPQDHCLFYYKYNILNQKHSTVHWCTLLSTVLERFKYKQTNTF